MYKFQGWAKFGVILELFFNAIFNGFYIVISGELNFFNAGGVID